MSSDRSDAGIRLLGYAAARRRSLLTDDALRPRRVGPRPDGMSPRTLPAVVNSRRVLPSQRAGSTATDLSEHAPPDRESEQELRDVRVDNRPLIDELSDTELAREAVASLRQHQSKSASPEDLAPALLELGADRSLNRADRRVPSGRHRNGSQDPEISANAPGKQRIRIVWAVAAAGVLALGTGFTAWAMNTPPETTQQQQTPPSQVPAPSAASVPTSAPADPSGPGTAPSTAVADLPTEIVPPATAAPEPVATAVPAVVITLGSGDAGFGWPSSAFGTDNP